MYCRRHIANVIKIVQVLGCFVGLDQF
jgi:hypothetical protein